MVPSEVPTISSETHPDPVQGGPGKSGNDPSRGVATDGVDPQDSLDRQALRKQKKRRQVAP